MTREQKAELKRERQDARSEKVKRKTRNVFDITVEELEKRMERAPKQRHDTIGPAPADVKDHPVINASLDGLF